MKPATRAAAITLIGVALTAFPAAASAQRGYWSPYPYGDAPYYGYYGYGAYDLPNSYGGYDGEVGGDDWYYDYYDLQYGYDDWWLDYYLDRHDVAELEAWDDIDDLEDLEDLEFDDERFDVSDDGRPWYGDTYMDWDTFPDEDAYETGIYDGYGFD